MKSEYEAAVKEREELQNQLDNLRKDQDADKQLMDSLKVSSGENSVMKCKKWTEINTNVVAQQVNPLLSPEIAVRGYSNSVRLSVCLSIRHTFFFTR